MFEGFKFAIPAFVTTLVTVVIGSALLIAGWLTILFNPTKEPRQKPPASLYTLTFSVLMDIAGPLAVWRLPYGFAQTESAIFKTQMLVVVWCSFLCGSLGLCIVTWLLARNKSGHAQYLIRMGSALLLIIWGLGYLLYTAGS